ncbi:MAG: hypothetical protein PHP82_01065 [Candidatus ainarchaeum sp.]|nr:hypothetical protein [Candidatus ainarchaeum sp.]
MIELEKKFGKCFRLFLIFFLIMIISLNVFAILSNGQIKIFAVTEKEDGMAADLFLYTIPGQGEVAFITSNSLVGKDTQLTGNIALNIAQNESNINVNSKNFVFDIKANASEVDGPSAGAAMTLLAYSVLSEKPLNKEIGITGTINSDGSIGVVGGIGAKAKVASEIGIKLLMIPSGQSVTYVKEDDGKSRSVNLLSYGPETLGLKVIEVSTIKDVLKYAYSEIDSIEVDQITSSSTFIPDSINFDSELKPMVIISKNYIDRAKNAIDVAEKELESSKLDDSIRAPFYTQLGKAKRDVELSQIYLDQNYLYSAANYSFNAHVSAGTIELIASTPSLLSSESKILNLKISDLRKEIVLLKDQMNFIPINGVEWLIGAQQRIAYAENALNNIENNYSFDGEEIDEQIVQYSMVNDFVSAQQWVLVAKDFFKEAKNSSLFKVPFYSEDFILKTETKIDSVEILLNDANLSETTKLEATRRLNASKISFDNNFYFAALYDAYFAESFFSSELIRINNDNSVRDEINKIYDDIELSSIWANLFYDHATFFIKNADFEEELERKNISVAILNTAFDLLVLSEKIEDAKLEVFAYLSSVEMEMFVPNDSESSEPKMEITYVRKNDFVIYFSILIICFLLLLLVFVMIGIRSSRTRGIVDISRAEKINFLLNRLDKALSQKKINDAEYFFLKKRYDSEYDSLKNFREERSKITLSLDESKTKLNALQRGLKDLKKHYKAGLIIPEDYTKHLSDVNSEIMVIKRQIISLEEKLKEARRAKFKKIDYKKDKLLFDKKKIKKDSEFDVSGTNQKSNTFGYSEFDVKGTNKNEKDLLKKEEKEKKIRRKILKKFKNKK